jgi:hypothetical protein
MTKELKEEVKLARCLIDAKKWLKENSNFMYFEVLLYCLCRSTDLFSLIYEKIL